MLISLRREPWACPWSLICQHIPIQSTPLPIQTEAPFRINIHPSIYPTNSLGQSIPSFQLNRSPPELSFVQPPYQYHPRETRSAPGPRVGCHLYQRVKSITQQGVHHVNKALDDAGAQYAHGGSLLHVQGPLHRQEGSRQGSHGSPMVPCLLCLESMALPKTRMEDRPSP